MIQFIYYSILIILGVAVLIILAAGSIIIGGVYGFFLVLRNYIRSFKKVIF